MAKRSRKKKDKEEKKNIEDVEDTTPFLSDIGDFEIESETKQEEENKVETERSVGEDKSSDVGLIFPSFEEIISFHGEISNIASKILRSRNIIDLETLTCLDDELCVSLFEAVIGYAKSSNIRGGSQIYVLERERALARYSTLLLSSHMLTPFEKEKLASILALEALNTFLVCIENPTFISRMENMALLFTPVGDTGTKALAYMICQLFKKKDDIPDSWLNRVEKIYRIIIENATSSLTEREPQEVLTL